MPLPNPFRRQPDRPSLRERAADLRASLAFRHLCAFEDAQALRSGTEPQQLDLAAAAGLDLVGLPLRDVAALHDVAVTIANVVRAIQMQPRGWNGSALNDVGQFTDWLGDQLDAQVDATVNELRRRTPADWIERDIRLGAIAEATVSNGDPAQTIAFARELLASVEK